MKHPPTGNTKLSDVCEKVVQAVIDAAKVNTEAQSVINKMAEKVDPNNPKSVESFLAVKNGITVISRNKPRNPSLQIYHPNEQTK